SCPEKIICLNGGYPHPKICNRCTCTDFHSGDRCENYDGIILTGQPGSKSHTITNSGPYNETEFKKHDNDWAITYYTKFKSVAVMGPIGKKLKVTLDKVHVYPTPFISKFICHYTTIEIVDTKTADLTMGGKFFCSDNRTAHSFVSHTNVIGFRGYAAPGFEYDFKVTVSVYDDGKIDDRTMRYEFGSEYTNDEKAWFRNQLAQISENTCLKMEEKNYGDREILIFFLKLFFSWFCSRRATALEPLWTGSVS
ncbi:hypothetical protein PENTCL1PPCAC_8164, partial [Pristionchus entomophagus]